MSRPRSSLPFALLLGIALAAAGGCGLQRSPADQATATLTAAIQRVLSPTSFPTWTPEPVTPTPTATPTATPTPIVYVIQKGDTLVEIASRFRVSASEIQAANGITDPRLLQIGQEIIIPQGSNQDLAGTPTPTPIPLRVLSLNHARTVSGDAIVMGEILNETAQGVEEVVLAIELRDASGHTVSSTEVTSLLDVVAPGEKAPFGTVITDAPEYASVACRVVRAVPEVPARAVHRELAIAEVSGRAAYDQTFVVIGKVRNSGDMAAVDLFVIVTLYGREGTIIGARREPLSEQLDPGARRVFEAVLVPIGWPVENFTVAVEGREAPPAVQTPTLAASSPSRETAA